MQSLCAAVAWEQELFNMVHGVSRELVSITSCIPRVADTLSKSAQPPEVNAFALNFFEL